MCSVCITSFDRYDTITEDAVGIVDTRIDDRHRDGRTSIFVGPFSSSQVLVVPLEWPVSPTVIIQNGQEWDINAENIRIRIEYVYLSRLYCAAVERRVLRHETSVLVYQNRNDVWRAGIIGTLFRTVGYVFRASSERLVTRFQILISLEFSSLLLIQARLLFGSFDSLLVSRVIVTQQ